MHMLAKTSILEAGGVKGSDHGYYGAYGRISAGTTRLETGERGGMGTEDLQWHQLAYRRSGATV